jgi:hypothetical protein
MDLRFDHAVLASRTLAEGVAWLQSRLDVPVGPGGKHATMGTHNRLVSLGPGRFLEVIAIDPEAPAPGRARWFELDTPAMRSRLAQGPALVTWVVRADDIERAVEACAVGKHDILSLARGDFRWRIGVAPSGNMVHDGIAPTIIQWSSHHPADVLPESGCRLEKLVLRHAEARATLDALRRAGLAGEEPIAAGAGGRGIELHVRTPRGIVVLE